MSGASFIVEARCSATEPEGRLLHTTGLAFAARHHSLRPISLLPTALLPAFLSFGDDACCCSYVELKAADVLKFGLSTREYVLMHDEMA